MNLSRLKKPILISALILAVPFMNGTLHAPSEVIAAPQKAKKPKGPKMFALNFKDVEIAEFINVMGGLIGKNIIIDDRVKGKISISSARKVPLNEAYNVMKAILEVKGLSIVETPNLIKILPIEEAIKKNSSIIVDGKPMTDERSITFLLEMKNADANEVANALRSLKSKNTDVVVYQSLNILIITGITSEVNGLIKIARSLDEKIAPTGPERTSGNIHVYHLENANADDLAAVLARIPFSESAKIDTSPVPQPQKVEPSDKARRVTQQHGAGADKTAKLSIISNKDTNSLIITAKPDEYAEILRVIKELDIVREQVLIEAMIVEVSVENGWGFGIDWMLGNKSGAHMYGGSKINSTNFANWALPAGLPTGKTPAMPINPGFQLAYMPDTSILSFALLNASATDSNFNILSTPQVLTIDNSEAELNVGEEIAVTTNNRITDQNTTFQTYEYKTVGIKLKITPHITQKKRITLDLYQEVNNILGESTQTSGGSVIPPKLGKRDIKTKVTVYDGKTIVVGGLISNKKDISESKVPLLGDIPVLGWLFKTKTANYKKTNLLVFITPHIVTKRSKLESITKEKMETMRRLRKK